MFPEVFVPYTVAMGMYTQILVRADVPPLTLLHSVRAAVNSIDPDQQTNNDVRDLEHWITRDAGMGAWPACRMALRCICGSGACVGVGRLLQRRRLHSVQRTNEFGIRIALGAKKGHVLGIVFRSTVASVGTGIVAGVILTLALNKVMASWAAESSRDPLLLLAATFVLSLVATLPA